MSARALRTVALGLVSATTLVAATVGVPATAAGDLAPVRHAPLPRSATGQALVAPVAVAAPTVAPTPASVVSVAQAAPAGTPIMTAGVLPLAINPMPVGSVGGTWSLGFNDDFDTFDASRWTPGWFGTGITNGIDPDGIECFDSANVAVVGGALQLKLDKRNTFCNGATRPYASSLVSSNGKFQFSYGYVEARAYVAPDGRGGMANWPALWTDGQNWPADGEIDYMEVLDGRLGVATHYSGSNSWSPVDGGAGTTAWIDGDLSGWHTFAAEWRPGYVDFYLDGAKVATRDAPFAGPHYLLMNNSPNPGRAFVPGATMQVDYIRVWKRA